MNKHYKNFKFKILIRICLLRCENILLSDLENQVSQFEELNSSLERASKMVMTFFSFTPGSKIFPENLGSSGSRKVSRFFPWSIGCPELVHWDLPMPPIAIICHFPSLKHVWNTSKYRKKFSGVLAENSYFCGDALDRTRVPPSLPHDQTRS